MKPQEKLLAVALAEVGYIEKASNAQLDNKTANPGKGNWTKYARDLDGLGCIYNGRKNGYDWCDVFVDWCFIQAFGQELGVQLLCQALKGLGAGVRYSAQYYKNKGQFYEDNPQPVDQIFFGDAKSWWHTGIVTRVDDKYVYTAEGNTTGAAGVVGNGGCVAEKRYPLNHKNIKGYGRPDWSLVPEEEEETEVRYQKLVDIPDKWNFRKIIDMLMTAGIIAGDGSDPDGNGDVIDLSHDMVRLIIFDYRAGVYDDAIRAAGLDPDVYK